jgi:DNA-binding SARP family transcriptional activator
VDRLIEQVWGEGAPPKPLASLRAYVTNLRRILGGDGVLVREGTGYRLDTAIDVVDVREFARLTAAGRRLLDLGDASGAKSAFDEALARWRGIPLADFRNLNFAMPEVHRLDTMRADAVESRFEAALRLGVSAELIADVESEVASNPMREKLWWQLMLAMHRSGRRTDALLAYGQRRCTATSPMPKPSWCGPRRSRRRPVNESGTRNCPPGA